MEPVAEPQHHSRTAQPMVPAAIRASCVEKLKQWRRRHITPYDNTPMIRVPNHLTPIAAPPNHAPPPTTSKRQILPSQSTLCSTRRINTDLLIHHIITSHRISHAHLMHVSINPKHDTASAYQHSTPPPHNTRNSSIICSIQGHSYIIYIHRRRNIPTLPTLPIKGRVNKIEFPHNSFHPSQTPKHLQRNVQFHRARNRKEKKKDR